MRGLRGLAVMGALLAGSAAATTSATAAVEGLRDALPLRTSSPSVPRGKHKPRRHGAKLRPNRTHMSRRAKRRHRRSRK